MDSSITLKLTAVYIGFRVNNKNLVDIHIQKKFLKIWLNDKFGTLNDSRKIVRDVSNTGDHEITISNDEDIEYIFSLIKKLYRMRSR